MVRVTGRTIPGPSGYASSSSTLASSSLYIAFTQQLKTDTLLPRDREPCLVVDLNGYGLAPGYYNARLAGSYQSLPLYEVGAAPSSPASGLSGFSGLTAAQVQQLSTLSPAQFAALANLDVCQLQVLLDALPISQVHTLTNTLTTTQLQNFVNYHTVTELTNLYTTLTTSEVIKLTTALSQQQVYTLTTVLTPVQIKTLTSSLTNTQIQQISTLPPAYVQYLVDNLTNAQLLNLLTNLTTAQIELLFGMTAAQVVSLVNSLSFIQLQNFLSVSPLPSIITTTVNPQTGTSYTVTAADLGRLVTLSNASPVAVTLPSAATFGPGYITTFQNVGTGAATLTPSIGTINGAGSLAVPAGQGITVVSDGTNWQIITSVAGATGIGGGVGTTRWTIVNRTTTYSASFGDFVVCDTSGGSFTIDLPASSGNAGKEIAVKNATPGPSTVTLDGSGAETINGVTGPAATYAITGAGEVIVVCDGSNWQVLSIS